MCNFKKRKRKRKRRLVKIRTKWAKTILPSRKVARRRVAGLSCAYRPMADSLFDDDGVQGSKDLASTAGLAGPDAEDEYAVTW